ncbi:MAG: PepSY-like domain-containing protein [Flavobacteriaceae bacterium]|jgi:hypothetical protein|nr:PepSY-like domain-containing protein [Flavobacteriaceae bacterium]
MKIKRILFGVVFSALLIVLSTTFLKAQDIIITKNELPKTAQNFIDKYFGSYTIGHIIKDNDVFSVDYEVNFTNGMEIKFDSNGNWEEVDGEHQAIQTGFISEKIIDYVNKHFPNTQITKIEKKTFRQEVKISNGLELIFNSSGNFIRIDD